MKAAAFIKQRPSFFRGIVNIRLNKFIAFQDTMLHCFIQENC